MIFVACKKIVTVYKSEGPKSFSTVYLQKLYI